MPAFSAPVHRRRLLRSAALAGLAALAIPAHALADTIVVDDDGAQCPGAGYTSLVAAVQSAAQGDTINVCAGTYLVPGGAGSQGLRVEKNISIRGQGADLVTIKPDPSGGPTIAAATPNERDEIGNIITVKKRVVELENFSISGVTLGDPTDGVAIESALAIIDVNESRVSDVRIRGSVPVTGPGTGVYAGALLNSGHGIVLANPEASSPNETEENRAVVRNVDISGFNKAGIVVDERRVNGTSPVGSNISATVTGTTITGFGSSSLVAQNGIEVWGGPAAALPGSATLKLSDSAITGVGNAAPVEGADAAVFLRGASSTTRIGPNNVIAGNAYGVYNGAFGTGLAAGTVDASGNWWGSVSGPSTGLPATGGDPVSANVATTPFLAVAPSLTPAPGPGDNDAPVVQFDSPLRDVTVEPGTVIDVAAIASDDFAVAGVELFAGDESLGSFDAPGPYEATFTAPTQRGSVTDITAVATDIHGATASKTIKVTVKTLPPDPEPEAEPEPEPEPEPQLPVVPVEPIVPPATPIVVVQPPLKSHFATPAKLAVRKGHPRIKLTLVDAEGKATIKFTVKRKVKGKTKTITVGTATGTFKKGVARILSVKLTAEGKKLFAGKSTLVTTATVTAVTGGKKRTAKFAYTLRK